MSNVSFAKIEKGLKEAIEFAQGKDTGARVYTPFRVDVKKIRKDLGMTQEQFAAAFGIGLGTLRHRERGDRQPRGAALVLLNLLTKDAETVLRLLAQGQDDFLEKEIQQAREEIAQGQFLTYEDIWGK
jgi:putative transcriptional regulator